MIPRDLHPLVEGEGYEFKGVGGNGGDIGHLTVKSTLVLFPADGQHRVASIKKAIRKHPELANVSIPVIFIPFRNRAAVRQMFSDLNLNAKPVNKSIGRSFETRDPVAVISKNVEKIVVLFNDRVNHMSNSLSASSANVITVNTLYEGTNALLRGLGHDVDALPEDKTDDYPKVSQEFANIWTHIISSLPGWANVTSGKETPSKLREEYVFAHGIGWQALAMAAAVIAEEGGASWLPKFEATLKSIDWSKTNRDWQNVCMVGDRMNNTGPGVRSTAGYILAKADMTSDKAKALINLYHKSIGVETSQDPMVKAEKKRKWTVEDL